MTQQAAKIGLVALIAAVALFFAMGLLLSAPATANPTDQINESDDDSNDIEEQYDTLFDLTIHSVTFEDRGGNPVALIEATWHGDTPESVTITQLPEGSNDVMFTQQRIYPDQRTEIVADLVDESDPAILYTSQSINEQRAIRIDDDDTFLIPGPWSATDAQIAGGAGLIAGLGLTTIFAYKRTRSKMNKPERKL